MAETISIPMNEATRIALEDCFIEEVNTDARKFIFDQIKNACKDATRSDRNQVTPVNSRDENGQPKQEEFKLKGIDMTKYNLDSNPAWLPKGMEATENKPIELKLGENTMKRLKQFGQIVLLRHEQYNIAEDKFLSDSEPKMAEAGATPEQIDAWKKGQETMRERRLDAVPKCLEEAVFVSVWPELQKRLDANDGAIFEKEFQEEYKPADKKTA